ncbi:hypothetical protein [Trinickia mobilis]|uniref:hypothetical protein n=1 Tax=Trinickia mobilis TaxID=2816356 RepID=UPI001A8D1306|nr:hypothetical protein [Trinickia mobilis]
MDATDDLSGVVVVTVDVPALRRAVGDGLVSVDDAEKFLATHAAKITKVLSDGRVPFKIVTVCLRGDVPEPDLG